MSDSDYIVKPSPTSLNGGSSSNMTSSIESQGRPRRSMAAYTSPSNDSGRKKPIDQVRSLSSTRRSSKARRSLRGHLGDRSLPSKSLLIMDDDWNTDTPRGLIEAMTETGETQMVKSRPNRKRSMSLEPPEVGHSERTTGAALPQSDTAAFKAPRLNRRTSEKSFTEAMELSATPTTLFTPKSAIANILQKGSTVTPRIRPEAKVVLEKCSITKSSVMLGRTGQAVSIPPPRIVQDSDDRDSIELPQIERSQRKRKSFHIHTQQSGLGKRGGQIGSQDMDGSHLSESSDDQSMTGYKRSMRVRRSFHIQGHNKGEQQGIVESNEDHTLQHSKNLPKEAEREVNVGDGEKEQDENVPVRGVEEDSVEDREKEQDENIPEREVEIYSVEDREKEQDESVLDRGVEGDSAEDGEKEQDESFLERGVEGDSAEDGEKEQDENVPVRGVEEHSSEDREKEQDESVLDRGVEGDRAEDGEKEQDEISPKGGVNEESDEDGRRELVGKTSAERESLDKEMEESSPEGANDGDVDDSESSERREGDGLKSRTMHSDPEGMSQSEVDSPSQQVTTESENQTSAPASGNTSKMETQLRNRAATTVEEAIASKASVYDLSLDSNMSDEVPTPGIRQTGTSSQSAETLKRWVDNMPSTSRGSRSEMKTPQSQKTKPKTPMSRTSTQKSTVGQTAVLPSTSGSVKMTPVERLKQRGSLPTNVSPRRSYDIPLRSSTPVQRNRSFFNSTRRQSSSMTEPQAHARGVFADITSLQPIGSISPIYPSRLQAQGSAQRNDANEEESGGSLESEDGDLIGYSPLDTPHINMAGRRREISTLHRPARPQQISTLHRAARPQEDISEKSPPPSSAQQGVGVAKGKGKAAQKRRNKVDEPTMPRRSVKHFAELFSSTKLSKDAIDEIMNVSEVYWKDTFLALEAYALHAGRKTVLEEDVILLMKVQSMITGMGDLHDKIREILPLEMRSELIPCVGADGKLTGPTARRKK